MRQHKKSLPVLIVPAAALIVHSSALITPLPVNRLPNNLAPNVPNEIPKNPPFCSFASFLIVLLTRLINKPDSLKDLTIFIISFISSYETINVVIPDQKIFSWIAASVAAAAAAVNPNGIKTLLTNGFSTFFIKDKPAFSNGPKLLPRYPADSPI